MSLPLKDFRLGIPESVDIWLEARAAAEREDKSSIARRVLTDWAKREAHAFKVAHRRLSSNGLQADWLGDELEDVGVAPAETGVSRNTTARR